MCYPICEHRDLRVFFSALQYSALPFTHTLCDDSRFAAGYLKHTYLVERRARCCCWMPAEYFAIYRTNGGRQEKIIIELYIYVTVRH